MRRIFPVALALACIVSPANADLNSDFGRARSLFEAGRYDAAASAYSSVAERYPGTPEGATSLFYVGRSREAGGDPAAAAEAYAAFVERYPENDLARFARRRLEETRAAAERERSAPPSAPEDEGGAVDRLGESVLSEILSRAASPTGPSSTNGSSAPRGSPPSSGHSTSGGRSASSPHSASSPSGGHDRSSSRAPAAATPRRIGAPGGTTRRLPDGTLEHIVAEGESLSSISMGLFGTYDRYEEIAALNGIDPPYTIFPGDLLVVSRGGGVSPARGETGEGNPEWPEWSDGSEIASPGPETEGVFPSFTEISDEASGSLAEAEWPGPEVGSPPAPPEALSPKPPEREETIGGPGDHGPPDHGASTLPAIVWTAPAARPAVSHPPIRVRMTMPQLRRPAPPARLRFSGENRASEEEDLSADAETVSGGERGVEPRIGASPMPGLRRTESGLPTGHSVTEPAIHPDSAETGEETGSEEGGPGETGTVDEAGEIDEMPGISEVEPRPFVSIFDEDLGYRDLIIGGEASPTVRRGADLSDWTPLAISGVDEAEPETVRTSEGFLPYIRSDGNYDVSSPVTAAPPVVPATTVAGGESGEEAPASGPRIGASPVPISVREPEIVPPSSRVPLMEPSPSLRPPIVGPAVSPAAGPAAAQVSPAVSPFAAPAAAGPAPEAEFDPEAALLHLRRASGLRRIGIFTEAEAEYIAAIRSAPENPVAYNNLADMYLDQGIKNDEAINLSRHALTLGPSDPRPYLDTLGWAYYMSGDLESAEETLGEALRISITASRLYHRARVYEAMGRMAEARADLEQARAYSNDPIMTRTIEAELSRMRGEGR